MEKEFFKNHIPQIARVVLGIIFCVSGVNYIFELFQINYSSSGQQYIEHIKALGFLWPLLKFTELICGLMLVFGYFGPLALFILAPITLGIIFFHIFLSPREGAAIIGYSAFALEVFLVFYWRKHFLHLFRDFFKDIDRHDNIGA